MTFIPVSCWKNCNNIPRIILRNEKERIPKVVGVVDHTPHLCNTFHWNKASRMLLKDSVFLSSDSSISFTSLFTSLSEAPCLTLTNTAWALVTRPFFTNHLNKQLLITSGWGRVGVSYLGVSGRNSIPTISSIASTHCKPRDTRHP